MIRFSLRCDKGHEFEDWFRSGSAFDEESAGGKLACPVCGSHRIEKAPMAPSVSGTKGPAKPAGCPIAGSDVPPCAGSCGCFE